MHAAGATIECLQMLGDPLAIAARWPEDQPLLMLHSGRLHPQWARWSILTAGVATYRFESNGRSRWAGEPPEFAGRLIFTHDPLIDLNLVTQVTRLKGDPDDRERDASMPPFLGGWIGWLSYDLGRWIEPRATF